MKTKIERATEIHRTMTPHQMALRIVELQDALELADEAVRAKQQAVPEDWQRVPRLPTNEMCAAFHKADSDWEDGYAFDDNGNRHDSPVYQWAAMLDAAPKPCGGAA